VPISAFNLVISAFQLFRMSAFSFLACQPQHGPAGPRQPQIMRKVKSYGWTTFRAKDLAGAASHQPHDFPRENAGSRLE
jgi:hypothetical protein